ncbi:hypothetical protein ABDK00_000235 [Niabella insulamsoli]|uniref:hypothetical protein n=1 Tax=Niabella insulamsoli TaxID=3144874 RepID=UPI0031FC48F2
MISFLTNEKIPDQLKFTIAELKRRQKEERSARRDTKLVVYGTFFLCAFAFLVALLVYFF